MECLVHYLPEEKKDLLKDIESSFQEATTIEEADRFYNQYQSIMDNAKISFIQSKLGESGSQCLNDKLTKREKEVIQKYEISMHKAWTKKGVDKYYNKIMSILENGKKR